MSSVGHRLLYPIVAGLLCLACAAVGLRALASAEPRTLSLRELASEGSVLMSCAEDGGSSGALLWCADPDSPHCIPALPRAPGTDLWQHGPIAVLTTLAAPQPRRSVGQLIGWPKPRGTSLVPLQLSQPLERPPKRA